MHQNIKLTHATLLSSAPLPSLMCRASPSPTLAAEDPRSGLFSPITAKVLLDEEMRKAAENSRERRREEVIQEELGMEDDENDKNDEDDEDDFEGGGKFVVTESDYDQLLREIEEEMRRDEELLLEEYESSLKSEGQYLEELLEGSGQDEGGGNGCNDDDDVVLCPICESCNLVQTEAEVILCRRRECGFRIDIMNDGLRLRDLKTNLGEIFLEHGMDCDKKLKFSVVNEFEISMVVGRCNGCVREFVVL